MTVRMAPILFSYMMLPMASFLPRYIHPLQKQPTCSPSSSQISTSRLIIRSQILLFSSSIQIKELYKTNQKQIFYMYKILLFATLILLASTQHIYQKVVLEDKSALCLDGSPGAYYIYKGDPAKVLLFFEGGGWCGDNDLSSTLQNCYQRSKTDLGSSTKYPQTISFRNGILSDDSKNFFRNWTRVFLKYCDGSGHQGTRSNPVLYKGSQIYFRGQNVTLAQFASIDKQIGILSSKVTQLVLTGESAGGLATFHWTNYFQSNVSPTTKFWSIPDSGVFIDATNILTKVNSYRIWFQSLLKLSNEETGTPNSPCNEANKNQLWKCMFAQYLIDYINAPVFAPQSLYDSWSLYNILGIRCMDGPSLAQCNQADRDTIEDYHRKTLEVMFRIASSNKNGVWAPVCINHCYLTNSYYASPNYRIPTGSEFSLIQTVADWIQGVDSSSRHIDFGDWPLNRPCSGLSFQTQ